MRALLLAGLFATLASSACSDETGIIVRTTAESGFESSIDSLTYYIGADMQLADDGTASFIDNEPFREDLAEGRDLAESPHKFLIRPPKDTDDAARYAIGVVAYSNGERVGFGYIQDPVGFVKGSVVQWDVEIRAEGLDSDCVRWALDETRGISVGPGNDRDCDGYAIGPDDCADDDPTRNRDAYEDCDSTVDYNCDGNVGGFQADGTPVLEVADGLDNNCDGICDGPETDGRNILDSDGDGFTTFGRYGVCNQEEGGPNDCDPTKRAKYPGAWDSCDNANCDDDVNEPTPCFQQLDGDGRCLQGIRDCPDVGYNCPPISQDEEVVSFALACDLVNGCAEDPNRALCLLLGLRAGGGDVAACRTYHSASTNVCPTAGGKVALPASDLGDVVSCTYQLVGPELQQGYRVKLVHEGTAAVGQMLHRCDGVSLEIKTTLASAKATILVGFSQQLDAEQIDSNLIKVDLDNVLADDCASAGGLDCTEFVEAMPANP